MQEITDQPTLTSDSPAALAAAAATAERWAGEPFLRPGEDPAEALTPGSARRRALDEAIAEIEAGHRAPTPRWKVRFGLMLGLERVLAEEEPQLASGTTLRRHQVDALAGMLTELISLNQREAELNGNGNGHGATLELVADEEEDEDEDEQLLGGEADADVDVAEPPSPEED